MRQSTDRGAFATERDLVAGLAAALASLPEVSVLAIEDQVPLPNSAAMADALLVLEVLGQPARLLIEAKAHGYPRDLREAARATQALRGNGGRPITHADDRCRYHLARQQGAAP